MKICYHGTDTEEKAKSILATGFNPDTWFAENLQDALGFGGPYIFEVAFDFDKAPNWQFHVLERVPVNRIVSCVFFQKEARYNNPLLRDQIFRSNMKTGGLFLL